jgi:hypothetical protein
MTKNKYDLTVIGRESAGSTSTYSVAAYILTKAAIQRKHVCTQPLTLMMERDNHEYP